MAEDNTEGKKLTEEQSAVEDFSNVFDAAVEASAEASVKDSDESEMIDADGNKHEEPEQKADEGEKVQDESSKESEPPDPMEALRAENAELKARMEALEASLSKQPGEKKTEQTDAKEDEGMPEELQALYEDFPTLRQAVQYEADRLVRQAVTGGINPADLQDKLNVLEFTNAVCFGFVDEAGKFVDGVPDAVKITSSKDYWDWFKEKGYQPGPPEHAIKILNEYKVEKLKSASRESTKKDQDRSGRLKEAFGGTIEPGNKKGNGSLSSHKATDFEGAFEEAMTQ